MFSFAAQIFHTYFQQRQILHHLKHLYVIYGIPVGIKEIHCCFFGLTLVG